MSRHEALHPNHHGLCDFFVGKSCNCGLKELFARVAELETEGRFSGTWADYHDHMTRKVAALESKRDRYHAALEKLRPLVVGIPSLETIVNEALNP